MATDRPAAPAATSGAGHLLSSVIALAALALFAAVHQTRWDKDSLLFLKWFKEGKLDYYHPLYLPLMTGFARVLVALGVDWMEAVRLYSCVCGAVAVWFVHRLCRRAGGGGYGTFAAALFAASPSVLYFATLPELNMGGIALLAATLWATDRAARGIEATWRETVLPALLLGLCCAHHTANALNWPGVVLLFMVCGERKDWPRILRFAVVTAAGVVLCSRLVPGAVFALCHVQQGSEYGTELTWGIFKNARWAAAAMYVLDQFVFFAGAILPLGLLGALSAARPLPRLRMLALTALPAVVLFGVWDRADTGAYYLPQTPFLLWHGAELARRLAQRVPRPRLVAVAALVVALQGAFSAWFLVDHNRVDSEGRWRDGMRQAIEERGLQRGKVIALVFGFQRFLDLELFLPGLPTLEMLYWADQERLHGRWDSSERPREFPPVKDKLEKDLLPGVDQQGFTLFLDAEAVREIGYTRPPGLGWWAPGPGLGVVLEGTRILAWLRERFAFEPVEKTDFRGWWLVRKGS